jgi:hypothetical protein
MNIKQISQKNSQAIKSPIFIVGCPRSGTTWLQSLLSTHPQIASFPESHFFAHLIPSVWLWRISGVASRRVKRRFQEYLQELGGGELQKYMPKFAMFPHQYVRAFMKLLNDLTKQQNKLLWLEKTPGHLHYINCIERFIPDAKFIHIIRNGTDVVASLYEVTHKHPEAWGGPRDIDMCVSRWIEDREIMLSHLHKTNHFLVQYEKLVSETEFVLKEICNFLQVPFDNLMLREYNQSLNKIVLKNETWKNYDNSNEKIVNPSKKFYEVFNKEQRNYILKKLAKY